MKEVKIVLVDENFDSDGDIYNTVTNSITDWESISDDDYKILKDNLWLLRQQYGNRVVLICEKDSIPVIQRILDIKDWIKEQKDRTEKEQADRKAKQDAKARARLLKKAGDEKKLLEELLKKYPDAIIND